MDATTPSPIHTAEYSCRAAETREPPELPLAGDPRFVVAAGLVAVGLGVVAGRLGVHFTGFMSTNVQMPAVAVPLARTLTENLVAWPAEPIVWSLALQPFGRARLTPLLAATAVARMLVVLLALFARSLPGLDGAEPSAWSIAELTTAAVAAIATVLVLIVAGVRRASKARGWKLAGAATGVLAVVAATEAALAIYSVR